MNKIITNTIFVFIAVIIFVVLGNMVFLLNIKQQLNKAESDLLAKRQEIEVIKNSLENTATASQKISDNVVLSEGQEGQLMGIFINEYLQKHFKVKNYDLYSSYIYKPENPNNEISASNMSNSSLTLETEKIPQLDENGMPVNAYQDSSNDEWSGLKVLPIKIAFVATSEQFCTILDYFQQLPVNTIRLADLIMNDDVISGTLVFAFPLNDYN